MFEKNEHGVYGVRGIVSDRDGRLRLNAADLMEVVPRIEGMVEVDNLTTQVLTEALYKWKRGQSQ